MPTTTVPPGNAGPTTRTAALLGQQPRLAQGAREVGERGHGETPGVGAGRDQEIGPSPERAGA